MSDGYQISEIFPGPGADGGASANCVTSFNGRNGQVVLNSQDVVDALGYVPGTGGGPGGPGDMTKVVYDPDNDGKVTAAVNADVAPWAGISGKPATFPPSAHNHTVADVTALQAALDGKAAIGHGHAIADVTSLQAALDGKAALAHGHAIGDVTGLQSALDAKAPLASPALTGTPTAPTAAPGTNTTQIGTTAFVQAAIAALVNSAPGALDTLNELAASLGNDPNFAATITNALAGKQPLDADLTALAGLGTTGFAVRTGADTWAARALLAADIPAEAARKDQDNGFTAKQTFNRATVVAPDTLADAPTIATDVSQGNRFRIISAVDRTLGAPTNPSDGQQCVWAWKNTDSAPHTLTLTTGAGGFRFGSDITVLTPTAAGKTDRLTAEYNATDDRWDVLGYIKGF